MAQNNQKVTVIILSLIIFFCSLYYSFRKTDINLNAKVPVWIVLSSKPAAHHFSTSLKFYDEIRFSATNFKASFSINNFEYKASFYNEITNNLDKGDTIKVWLDKEYQKQDYITVYGLEYKAFNYISISERNAIKSRYNKYGLIVTFYSIFLLINIFIKKGVKLTVAKTIGILVLILIGIYRITK
jgi:hypothetical protein